MHKTESLTSNTELLDWVAYWTAILRPDAVEWLDGSEAERHRRLVDSGTFLRLDPVMNRPGFGGGSRENKELRRANDILKAASIFFATELDRSV